MPILAVSAEAKSRVTQRPAGVPSGVFSINSKLESGSITMIEGLPLRGVCISIEMTGWSKEKSMNSQSLSDIIVSTGPKFSPRVKSLEEQRISFIPSPFKSIPESRFIPTFSPLEPCANNCTSVLGPLDDPRQSSTLPDFEPEGAISKKSSKPSSLISPAGEMDSPSKAFAEVPFRFPSAIGPVLDPFQICTLPEW